MPKNQIHRKFSWRKSRWILALIGLILLVLGQFQIAKSAPPSAPPTQFGQWLNNTLHFDIPNIDNVVNGLPILLVGGILLAISLYGLRLLPSEKDQVEKKPFAFHLATFGWPGVICAIALFGLTLLSLATRDYSPWMLVCWVISVLIFVTGIAIWDQRRGTNLSPGLTRRDVLWILGLITLGLVIGVYRLQGLPDSLVGDDGNFWTAARDIATGAFKPPIFAVGVYSFPVLSSYIQAWILKVFGITFWGWRFGSVLSGVFTILPLYLLARAAFNRKVAIISAFALIFSPYFLSFSRLGYISIQALFITTLALYWLYIGLIQDSYLYLFLAGCASGLGFYTFFSARIALLIGIAFIGFMWVGRKIKFRHAIFAMGLLSFGALLIAGPYFAYGFSHDPSGMSYKIFESLFFNVFNGEQFYSDKDLFAIAPPFQINGNILFYNPKIYLVLIIRGLGRTMLAFQKPGLITEHFISSSLTGTVGAFFYLIGLGVTLWKFKQPRSQLLLLWFFGVVFGLSALNTVPPRQTHMVSIIPALALLTGVGLYTIASAASAIRAKLGKFNVFFLATGIIALSLGGFIDFFLVMPSKNLPQPDQVMGWAVLYANDESFYYIYANSDEKDFQPYVITEFRQSISFKTISVDSFSQSALALDGNKKIISFYTPSLADKVEPIMQSQWGNKYIQKTFYSTDGTPVLAAGMNTPFVFVRDQTLLAILKDSYIRPTFLVLLSVIIGLLAYTVFMKVSWTYRMPKRLKRLAIWFNGSETTFDQEDEQESFSIEDRAQPIDELPAEPPEWAEQVFQSDLISKPERPKVEFSKVDGGQGKDYYFKVHLPSIRIMGFKLPGKIQFAFPSFQIPNPGLLTLSVLLAITAQIMIVVSNSLAGIILFLLSGSGLIVWIRVNPKWTNVFGNQWRISPRAEKLLIAVLLAITVFLRYYDLSNRVYGLVVDEIKWTVQSWYSTILMLDKGELLSHYLYLPVGFWMRSTFLRLFGLNFISARIGSATLNIISIVFLYLLVRRLTASKPLALLSTFLYSFSFIDLTIAHQALAQTMPEIWIISSFYFLIVALQERKWWQFQVTGILLALGMLTFEIFLPIPFIAMLYLAWLGLSEIIKKRTSARKWLEYLCIVAWPIILTYVVYTQGIIPFLRESDFSILMQFFGSGSSARDFFPFLFRNVSQLFQTIFSHIITTDSLVNWGGPLINPFLLPFVVIGFVYNLWNIRRPYFILIPLWFIIFVAAESAALGVISPVVLYPVLTPLTIWGAMGLWTFLGALRAFFDVRKLKLALPIFIISIIVLTYNDYHIFTTSLADPTDQQKLRELADLSTQSAEKVPMVLYPYIPGQEDSVALESNVILLSVAGGGKLGQDAENHFKQMEFNQLLGTIWKDRQLTGVDLIFDKTANLQVQTNNTLNIVFRCYPGAVMSKSGQFFTVYHFTQVALSQPKCYQGATPVTIAPQDGAGLISGNPITLAWDTSGVVSTSHQVTIERKITGTYLMELEDTFTGLGWDISSDFVKDFSGKGFLLDEWQAGIAQYNFPLPEAGQYRIWIRSYKRRVNDQHNFITLDGKKVEFAGDKNMLDAWVWDDLGTYNLSQGKLPITLSRTYGIDEEYSVFIDVLLITSDTVNPPDQIKLWENVINTGEISSSAGKLSLPEILPPGNYRWKVRIFDSNKLVDSSGMRGLDSLITTFTISP